MSIHSSNVLGVLKREVGMHRDVSILEGTRPVMKLDYAVETLTVHKVPLRTLAAPFSPWPNKVFTIVEENKSPVTNLHCTIGVWLALVGNSHVGDLGNYRLLFPHSIEHYHPFVSKPLTDVHKLSQGRPAFDRMAKSELTSLLESITQRYESKDWGEQYRQMFEILSLIESGWAGETISYQPNLMYYQTKEYQEAFSRRVAHISHNIISRVEVLPEMYYNEVYRSVVYADQSEPLFFGR